MKKNKYMPGAFVAGAFVMPPYFLPCPNLIRPHTVLICITYSGGTDIVLDLEFQPTLNQVRLLNPG